jgi:hypothetical protein
MELGNVAQKRPNYRSSKPGTRAAAWGSVRHRNLPRAIRPFVISRNTAFTCRDKRVDTKQIGRELGVRYVLEGSVQRSTSSGAW